ncbi:MAG: hypothetical protein COB78_07250 [Hyphomicrobiales bacterium]|nr:MAG: hypothetical protein COB78_07250 [Hyphomicrobiales bacterium]
MSAHSLINSLNKNQSDTGEQINAVILHVMDSMSVLLAGLETAEGKAISQFYSHGNKTETVAGMASIIRFSECDDIHIPSCVSPGCIAIPTALAFAKDGEGIANAVEAGYGVGLAFAKAIGGVKALDHGVWPTLFAAPAIAAVTCAVSMGFSEKAIAQALVLAMSGTSGRTGRPQGFPSGRWLAIGEATIKGIRAAQAVRNGFCGDENLFSDQWLASQTQADLVDSKMLHSVPKNAVQKVGLKPFVSARQGANAIKVFLDLLDDGLSVEDIHSVEVYLPVVAVPVVARELDLGNRLSTIANLGLQFGIAAFERSRLLDVDRKKSFKPQTIAFAKKVKITADPDLQTDDASVWPARVKIFTTAENFEQSCHALPGDPGDNCQMDVVTAKIKHFNQLALFDEVLAHQENGLAALNRAKKNLYAAASQRFAEQCSQSENLGMAS